jgi:hypothetical protein
MHRPEIIDYVLWAEHDQACCVCTNRKAVLDMQRALFLPCWQCQAAGWTLIRKKKRLGNWKRRLKF